MPADTKVTTDTSTILLVSENPHWRQEIRSAILKQHCSAMPAINGKQAITLYNRFAPDIVLLDATNNRNTALTLCRTLRQQPTGRSVPILMVCDEQADSSEAFEAGATDILNAPLNWNVLGHQIPRHIAASNAIRSNEQTHNHPTSRLIGLGHWQWDAISDVFICSQQIRLLLPGLPNDATLEDFIAQVPESSRASVRESFHLSIARRQSLQIEHSLQTKDNREIKILLRGHFHSRQRPGQALLGGSLHDITEKAHKRNTQSNGYDELTGLLNQQSFKQLLKDRVRHASKAQQRFALLYLNLDDFSHINNRLGRNNADQALKKTAQLLKQSVNKLSPQSKDKPILARLEEDQFALLLPQISTAKHITRYAETLLQEFELDSQMRRYEERLNTSIGIALYPIHGHSHRSLSVRADAAMHLAKSTGKSRYRLASREIAHRNTTQDLSRRLENALTNNEFTLNYQPQIDLKSGQIHTAEALLRWQPDHSNLVMPGRFLNTAENLGLMQAIDHWVIKTSARDLADWQNDTENRLNIAINLSLATLRKPTQLKQVISTALRENDLNPEQLSFEVDERIVMENSQTAMQTFRQLSEMGCQIVLDNFDTTLCSLTTLKHLNLSAIKIARGITRDSSHPHGERLLLKAMSGLAHDLDLKVIAQGTETRRQLEMLQTHGYDSAQGFFIGMPSSAKQLQRLLLLQAEKSHSTHAA